MYDENPISGHQSLGEEIFSSIVHGIGVFLAIAGMIILIVKAVMVNQPIMVVGYALYGFGSISLYLSSTLFHSITHKKAKDIFSIFDQSAIYLLIAGTYTPITFAMRNPLGWTIFGIVWGLTIIGIVMQCLTNGKSSHITNSIYLAMGWLFLVFLYWMMKSLPTSLFIWLAYGAASYSIGVVFYAWRKLPYHHPIWHIFVIGGTVCHFFGLLGLVK
jgi:hemolysin III